MAWERLVPESISLKGHLHNLQGKNNTWYCGMSAVYGYIEFALISGFVIAKQLGAKYPFAHNNLARSNFNAVEDMMIRGFFAL
jgi:predicted NAD/FAD-binding protein